MAQLPFVSSEFIQRNSFSCVLPSQQSCNKLFVIRDIRQKNKLKNAWMITIRTSARPSSSWSSEALGTILSPFPMMAHFTITFWGGCHHYLIGERNEAEPEKQAKCTKVTLDKGRKCLTEGNTSKPLPSFLHTTYIGSETK